MVTRDYLLTGAAISKFVAFILLFPYLLPCTSGRNPNEQIDTPEMCSPMFALADAPLAAIKRVQIARLLLRVMT